MPIGIRRCTSWVLGRHMQFARRVAVQRCTRLGESRDVTAALVRPDWAGAAAAAAAAAAAVGEWYVTYFTEPGYFGVHG
jgi:hypothetical protein